MATAQDYYKSAAKVTIGPAVRAAGFKGSVPNWVLTADNGDCAVINLQSSSSSSRSEVRFVVNLAVIPVPWWEWREYGPVPIRAPKEYHGLWRDRLHPATGNVLSGSERWWQVVDPHSAEQAAREVVSLLESRGIPTLRPLLDRDALIETIRAGDLGFAKGPAMQLHFDIALAVMLVAEGCREEVEPLLEKLSNTSTEPAQTWFAKLRVWVDSHAE